MSKYIYTCMGTHIHTQSPLHCYINGAVPNSCSLKKRPGSVWGGLLVTNWALPPMYTLPSSENKTQPTPLWYSFLLKHVPQRTHSLLPQERFIEMLQPHSIISLWEVPVNSFSSHLVSFWGLCVTDGCFRGMPSGPTHFPSPVLTVGALKADVSTEEWSWSLRASFLNGLFLSLPIFSLAAMSPCGIPALWTDPVKESTGNWTVPAVKFLPFLKRKEKSGIYLGWLGKEKSLCVCGWDQSQSRGTI